jgi:hypothetical protein
MTQRYSHLAPDSLRGAVNILEAALKPKEENKEADMIPIQQKA